MEEIFLKEKLIQEGLSSKEIAALTFSSKATISRRLKKLNLSPVSISRRTTGSHVMGYRKLKGIAVANQNEQKILERIVEFRNHGHSYQLIASKLNQLKIPTKKRKSMWHAKVVRQIYLRQITTIKKN